MALLDLWNSSRAQVVDKHISQLLAFAGNGRLGDGTPTSGELRCFLAEVPSPLLKTYVGECLTAKFDQSGFVLQDLVNEIGRRLGFEVEHGRYRGVQSQPGNDGLWHSKGRHIVVEVKTTDAYRINLDTLAHYRSALIDAGKAELSDCSILIVVGREDTGDLEAQIRGSRYAWDIRLVSADSLLRLLSVKESVDDPTNFEKVVGILTPQEFTRVDGIVELVFRTAEDIQDAPAGDVSAASGDGQKGSSASFNDECARRAEAKLGRTLTKASRTLYKTSDGRAAAVCLASKLYDESGRYWFAFHPRQQDALQAASDAYIVLGCGSSAKVLMIPFREFNKWLPGMFKTETETGFYWHININAESMNLYRRKGEPRIDLSKYLL